MIRNNYICALDIGSSKIDAAVALLKKGRIADLFFETDLVCGVKSGSIVDSVALINCIGRVLKNLKTKSQVKVKEVFVNISGIDLITRHSYAVIPLAERGNKVIALSDLRKVNEQARILGSSLEEEIIHQIPLSYGVDSKKDIANPLGLYSHKLEVDLFMICTNISSVENILRVINQSGYDLGDLYFSGLSLSKILLDNEVTKGTAIICDMGSDFTELLVFKNGILRNLKILPYAGRMLSDELSEKMNIPFELAEEVKISYTNIGYSSDKADKKEILIKKDGLYKPIRQKDASEIINSKAQELCLKVKSACEEMVAFNEVDSFIACGRTILLEGLLEMLESSLELPVKLARIKSPALIPFVNQHNQLSGQKYITHLTCLGLIQEALEENYANFSFSAPPYQNPLLRLLHRARELYQEYF